jgi:propionate CoA-transferase
VMFDMHRDAAAKRPGVLTKVGLGTFVDPQLQGCAMNDRAAGEPVVRKVRFADQTGYSFRRSRRAWRSSAPPLPTSAAI